MELRCFVAIELEEKLRRTFESLLSALKKTGADAKWVKPANLHLTLKFLGNVPEEKIPELKEALLRAASGAESFRLHFRGTGVFPSERKPRVVWAGIEDSMPLLRLAESVERETVAIGLEASDRQFRGHLTLGRLRSPGHSRALVAALRARGGESWGSLAVDSFSLMKSELGPSGPSYERLGLFTLPEPPPGEPPVPPGEPPVPNIP